MTPDDIERMAREAGFPFNKYGLLQGDDEGEIDATDMLARFAALVQAAERERILSTQASGLAEMIRSQERERCAKVCEDKAPAASSYFEIAERLRECAAAIRGG